MGNLLEDCRAVTMAEMNPIWVSEEFIADNELPISIWAPLNGEWAAVSLVSGERANAQGLTCRPTRETARGPETGTGSQSAGKMDGAAGLTQAAAQAGEGAFLKVVTVTEYRCFTP